MVRTKLSHSPDLSFDTLLGGKVLFVDELDSKLHPMMTRASYVSSWTKRPTLMVHSSSLPHMTHTCLTRNIYAETKCGSLRRTQQRPATYTHYSTSKSVTTVTLKMTISMDDTVPYLLSNRDMCSYSSLTSDSLTIRPFPITCEPSIRLELRLSQIGGNSVYKRGDAL